MVEPKRGLRVKDLMLILDTLPPDMPIRTPDNQGGSDWLDTAQVIIDTRGETEIIPGQGRLPVPPHLALN